MKRTTLAIILFLLVGVTVGTCCHISRIAKNQLKNTVKQAVVFDMPLPNTYIPLRADIKMEKVKKPYSNEDVVAIALMLAGECYDDKPADKRKVVEVVVNRVSNGQFGSSIMEVITAPNQFYGYWTQSRPVSENDILIAEETLRDWHANGCQALSEYLFFRAGPNRENIFSATF